MEEILIRDLIKEAERELAVRSNAYPGWVARGKIKQSLADRRLALMREIVELLKSLENADIGALKRFMRSIEIEEKFLRSLQ